MKFGITTIYLTLAFFSISLLKNQAAAQLSQCKAELKNDTFVLENSKLKRTFLWNKGALQHFNLFNKIKNQLISGTGVPGKSEVCFPGINAKTVNGSFRFYNAPATNAGYEYLAAEVIADLGTLHLKNNFRIYADCPAIVCDYNIRGKTGD